MYILLLILFLIDSFYVYGSTGARIGVTLLLVFYCIIKGIKLSKMQIVVFLLFLFSFLVGMLNYPETCLMEAKIFVFMGLYSILLRYKWDVDIVNKFLIATSYLVNIYLLIAIFLFFIGINIDFSFLPESNFVVTGESFGFSSSVLQSLAFYLTFNGALLIKNKSLYSAIPFMLGVINVILSQRRAFFVFPGIILLFCCIKYTKLIKNIPLIILLSLAVVFGIGFFASFFTDMSAVEYIQYNLELISYDDDSDGMRLIQSKALQSLFEDSPLWGQGLGAYSSTCIRDEEMPFSYELSLFALLVKFGFPIFVFLVVLYFKGLYKIFRREGTDLPIALGSLCLFLANTTNPYINVSTALFLILPFTKWSKKRNQ